MTLPGRDKLAPISQYRPWLVAVLLVLQTLAIGCDPPPRPTIVNKRQRAEVENPVERRAEVPASDETFAAKPAHAKSWETWQAYYAGDEHVGYNHVSVVVPEDRPDGLVRVQVEDQVALRRGPATIVQRIELASMETRGGDLVSFEAEWTEGPALTRYAGVVDGEQLTIVTTRGTQKTTRSIPWQASYAGPVGIQHALLSSPSGLGWQQRLQCLFPVQFATATVELDCRHPASIAMPDGTVRRAREVEVAIRFGKSAPIPRVLWIDDRGNVVKSFASGQGLSAFDSSQQAATEAIVSGTDLVSATAVELMGELAEPQRAQSVLYRLMPRRKQAAAAEFLAAQPGQWIKPTEAGGFDLLVSRVEAADVLPGFEASTLVPGKEDSKNGRLVDAGNPLIRQLAATAIAPKDAPGRLALELTRSTHALVGKPHQGRGFLPASEVARTSEGDSTAHAVLLTAMLRARSIPARVAVGLVVVPAEPRPRMAYHMWTLAFVDGRWLHLDATLSGGALAPADRIVLATSALDDGKEFELFAPVLATIRQYDIAVVPSTDGPAGAE